MAASTIDLTSIPSHWSQALVDLEFHYGRDGAARAHVHAMHKQQRKLIEGKFSQWLLKTNAKLIEQVTGFVNHSMGLNKDSLFFDKNSNLINAATLVLGMHASDHKLTLDLIADNIEATFETIQIYRITTGFIKRAHFIDLIYEIRDQTHVLVIIEQFESIDKRLLESFINILYDLLNETELDRAMILFCMSGNWDCLGVILPTAALNRLIIRDTFVKDTQCLHRDIDENLLALDECTTKIGPSLLDYFYYAVTERDVSVTHLQYLFQYSLLEHNLKTTSFMKLPRNKLTQLFKSDRQLIDRVTSLKSLRTKSSINSNSSPEKVANFCVESVDKARAHFKFIWFQLQCYFVLLGDQTGQVFPSHLFDLYDELLNHDNLGSSKEFLDALLNLKGVSASSLAKRLESSIFEVPPEESHTKGDIRPILIKYRDKLNNNRGSRDIIENFTLDLLSHAITLSNPTNSQMSEVIYFDDCESIMHRTLPATRLDATKSFMGRSNFGLLYQCIHDSPEEISLHDLYEDFACAFDDDVNSKPKKSGRRLTSVQSKSTPKRSTRLDPAKVEEKPKFEGNSVDKGLKKAIFIDLISCLEYQGLIKRDTRQSKKGFIRRSVWL